MEVVHFQAGELTQAHVDDSLGLRVGESETFGKLLFGSIGRLGMADNADYLVDIVAGDDQTFENMSLFLCFAQFVFCAPDHHVVAVVDECFYKILEIEQTRTSVDKSHVVDRECRLHCCHLVELVEHHIGVGVLTELDDDAHALVVALVVDVGDAFDFFLVDKIGDIFYQLGFVDTVGNFVNDDGLMLFLLLNVGVGADHDASAAGLIGLFDPCGAVDGATCGEVGRRDMLHQLRNGDFGVVEIGYAGID